MVMSGSWNVAASCSNVLREQTSRNRFFGTHKNILICLTGFERSFSTNADGYLPADTCFIAFSRIFLCHWVTNSHYFTTQNTMINLQIWHGIRLFLNAQRLYLQMGERDAKQIDGKVLTSCATQNTSYHQKKTKGHDHTKFNVGIFSL